MNYKSMDCLSDGIIIEELNTENIVYINRKMRDILKISEDKNITAMADVIHNENVEQIKSIVRRDLNERDVAEGTVYFKAQNGSLAETSFKCQWFDRDKDLALFVFENSVEIVNEDNFDFQEVTEFLPSGVMVMNIEPELFVKYANEEQYKILDMDSDHDAFNKLLKYSIYEEDRDWVLAEIYDNLYKGKDVDIEFRMKGKRNTAKWVRLYGRARTSATGERLFYSSLKDLSSRREINDKLHLERVLFQKVTELTDEIIFRIDLQTNIIYFIGRENNLFAGKSAMENFPKSVIDMNVIYEEDVPTFLDLVECFKNGVHKYVETRYTLPSGEVEWYKTIYNFVKDSEGKPLLVIGKLVNIQDQKLLEEQAKKDLLTGFYNKIVTEIEINNLISDSKIDGEHALFIIDIDHFKAINDNLGHHFGDFVLREVSNDIKNCFRKDDIFGRIGGDEFIVVMRSCSDNDIVLEKASHICNALQKTYMGEKENYSISASVGIAVCPADGSTFETLYQMADKALYQSKENGRNCFTRYNKDFVTNTSRMVPDINHSYRRKNDLIDYEVMDNVFNLLYDTKDIMVSLNACLKYLGDKYKVDRTYIYEGEHKDIADEHQMFTNTFLWEREGVKKTSVKRIDRIDFDVIFENSNSDGVFYTNDVSQIQNESTLRVINKDEIMSIFLMKLNKDESDIAFFGIDDCAKKRIWSERDIKTLFQVSRMMFMVLLNHHEVSELRNKLENK